MKLTGHEKSNMTTEELCISVHGDLAQQLRGGSAQKPCGYRVPYLAKA
jgi:hypothetical protein